MEGNFQKYVCIVGIDFGTTYSGVSHTYIHDGLKSIEDIKRWEKQGGAVYPKVPTVLLYENGTKNMIAWGYDAIALSKKPENTGHLVERFKLMLDPSVDNVNRLPNGLTVLEVIADYLRGLHEYTIPEIKRVQGRHFTQDKMMYCLTVPAIWSDQAKATMREAAIQAGIISSEDPPDRLILTSEPEAAALYCKSMGEIFQLKSGDRFMICDAGGGTVDLIVFELHEESKKKVLREITKGSGGFCGSTYLDANVQHLIENRFGEHAPRNTRIIEHMVKSFINGTKADFDGEDDVYMDVITGFDFEGQDETLFGIDQGSFQITAEDLCNNVFNPVIQDISSLIQSQLNQTNNKLDAIFLVGGFGQSRYLSQCIRKTFGNRVPIIASPHRGEMAIARGAVAFGLQPRAITHRVMRRTYGVDSCMRFDKDLDSMERCIEVPKKGKFATHRFSVFVKRGDSIAVGDCITHDFFINYPNDTETDLYAYGGDNEIPRYTSDPGVEKVGFFPIKIPIIIGAKYGQDILMKIKMYFGLTEIKIEAIINGETLVFMSKMEDYESQKTVYDPEPSTEESPYNVYYDSAGLPVYPVLKPDQFDISPYNNPVTSHSTQQSRNTLPKPSRSFVNVAISNNEEKKKGAWRKFCNKLNIN
ncbi:hypothetical protein CLU79DRAFT_779906 [Phycomyces nitens]|nr:hypothetical protein CLU79DRAFT_779906 [Phycomyces nitens]